MMNQVWLAECVRDRPEILGVFSTPDAARESCQDVANHYFGAAHTPRLPWMGNEEYSSASYCERGSGLSVFQVTRFTVDAGGEQKLIG